MNKKNFIEEFEKTVDKMCYIVVKKNNDYSNGSAFENFNLVEKLDITTTEKGILIRMLDKINRIKTLLDKENEVKNENIQDTLIDLANYSIILSIYIGHIGKNI